MLDNAFCDVATFVMIAVRSVSELWKFVYFPKVLSGSGFGENVPFPIVPPFGQSLEHIPSVTAPESSSYDTFVMSCASSAA